MAVATTDRPQRSGDSNLALASQHADLSGSAISSRADNAVYHAAQPRTDMAELSAAHGFPSSEALLPQHPGQDVAAASRPDISSPMPSAGADSVAAASPEHLSAAKPVGDAAAAPPTEVAGTHDVYDVHVQSTIGNDTKVAIDSAPTSVPSEATPSTAAASPLDSVEARAAAPVDQPQHQFDATPPAPQNTAQNDQVRFNPPARTDLG